MPTSKCELISDVCELYRQLSPWKVLDVGVGWGHYGVLFRMISDVRFGRIKPTEWKTRIEGCEVWKAYFNANYNAYDKVHNCDIQALGLEKYDLVYCGDVIEHFTKPEAVALIEKLKAHSTHVMITLPLGHSPQGAVFGNPHEAHQSDWTEADFHALGFKTFAIKANKGLFWL